VQREFSEPVFADQVNFILDIQKDATYIIFTDKDESYKIERGIYDEIKSYMNDKDREIMKNSRLMRDILQTADTDGNYIINMKEVWAIYFSRDLTDRLIELVNMHYHEGKPKLSRR
jgi:5S rRNA maturation endonuclease (ribonuclease M5)